MFNYLFLFFIVLIKNLKNCILLKFDNTYESTNIDFIMNNTDEIKNLTTMFDKYKLLKKLENNEIKLINDNEIIIQQFNILNGGLLQDWEF